MAWHRGLLVCENRNADAVEDALALQAVACRLTRCGDEVAFAFAARNMPRLERLQALWAGIDGSSISVVIDGDPHFQPKNLIIHVGYTIGVALRLEDIAELERPSPLRALWRTLAKPSDESNEGGLCAYRWDLDEAPLHASSIDDASCVLRTIADGLAARRMEHRIALFEAGFGTIRGGLECSETVFCGPDVHLTIKWSAPNGSLNFVTANTSEFIIFGDDFPDSELWHP